MQHLRYSPYIKPLFGVLDGIILLGTVMLFNREKQLFLEYQMIIYIVLICIWGLLSTRTRIYQVSRTITFTKYLERLSYQLIFLGISLFLISKITLRENEFHLFSTSILFCFSIVFLVSKSILFFSIKWLRTKGFNRRNVMFLSYSDGALLLNDRLSKRKDYGFHIFEFTGTPTLENLADFWKSNGIDLIYIPMKHHFDQTFITELLDTAEKMHVKTAIIPDILLEQFSEYEISYTESQPILKKINIPLKSYPNAIIKRGFDIIFSVLFLSLIGIWLFPLIAIFIKKDSPGKVFFLQERYGKNRKIFRCIKFRTMVENGDSSTKTTLAGDKRITKIGKFLRRTSLDETPQFLNVLLGEMSIVGPRPHMLVVDDYYKTIIERYNFRNKIRPGITGLSQITGLRGESDNMLLEMQKRILSDTFYIRNWTLSIDLIIIVKTIFVLIKGDTKAF